MKCVFTICFFIILFSSLHGQTTNNPNTEFSHCPEQLYLYVEVAGGPQFFCNSKGRTQFIIHSGLRRNGQELYYPQAKHQHIWSTDGQGTISEFGAGSAKYIIDAADFKTGWIKIYLNFLPDPSLACLGTSLKDSVIIYLMSYKVNAGEHQTICTHAAVNPVELQGNVLNDNNPGFSNLYIWETMGTGDFSNPYILSTTYTPSSEDISNGSVKLVLKVRKSECREDDFVTDTVNLHFAVCNALDPFATGKGSFHLYPIPATDRLTIQSEHTQEKELKIFSSEGKVVQTTIFVAYLETISLSLPPGIYKAVVSDHFSVSSYTLLISE